MKVLITGGAGFIGQLLGTALLNDREGKYEVVLSDIVKPQIPARVKWPNKAQSVQVDLSTEAEKIASCDIDVVFILHGIMSSGAEADFELGMKVNFDATRALLDALRRTKPGIKVIYTSSQAVYGGEVTEPVGEAQRPTPENSYGCEKMMCELLINEYNRRGFLDGLIFRLPTVSVRAGKPTAAASSFLSGIIREPMQGLPCVLPLSDRGFKHWLTSPSTLINNLLHAISLSPNSLPDYDRVICMPGIGVTIQDMMDSLARVGGEDKLKHVTESDDEDMKRILYSWPGTYDNDRALRLGFKRDASFDDIVREFKSTLDVTS